MIQSPHGVIIFQVEDNMTGNATQPPLKTTVEKIRQVSRSLVKAETFYLIHITFIFSLLIYLSLLSLFFYIFMFIMLWRNTHNTVPKMGELWHCLMVVVVSDDPTFLAAFAHLSLKRHALRWSTRILVLTRLPLSQLSGLHGLLSSRNAMLLRVQDNEVNR